MMKLLVSLALLWLPLGALAAQEFDIQAVQGYDVVSYFREDEAIKGDGNFAAQHDGKTYLFSSKVNKELFEKNPDQYLPQYGGWCAFGVSKGKKFASDATAWSIVDGKLYLNLNKKVQGIWKEDPEARIEEADENWAGIKDKAAGEL